MVSFKHADMKNVHRLNFSFFSNISFFSKSFSVNLVSEKLYFF